MSDYSDLEIAPEVVLVLGAVEHAIVGDGRQAPPNPLVYYDRTFRRLGQPLQPEKARPTR